MGILYEILQYHTDIICLTEVDKVHFESFYLLKHKYDGLFLLKNSINHSSHIEVRDGLAIFWKMDKIIFMDKTFECILGASDQCFQNALGARFGLKTNKLCKFDVYNTHLKAGRNNECERKRVIQCDILMDFIKKNSDKMPVILCGDLNLHFDELINDENERVAPMAYNFLTNGCLKDVNESKNDEDTDEVELRFDSVWNGDEWNQFSVYAGWMDRCVKECFDYIMIAQWKDQKNDTFVVEEVLNGFTEIEIEKYDSRLPNEDYSSDHFLIAAKFGIGVKEEEEIKEAEVVNDEQLY